MWGNLLFASNCSSMKKTILSWKAICCGMRCTIRQAMIIVLTAACGTCACISQIGKPVVLCGCAVPKQFENHPEREWFSDIYYLAVVCEDTALEERMRNGRRVTDEDWIKSSLSFNGWLKENAAMTSPPVTLLDTSGLSPEQASEMAHHWITGKMGKHELQERAKGAI